MYGEGPEMVVNLQQQSVTKAIAQQQAPIYVQMPTRGLALLAADVSQPMLLQQQPAGALD